MAYENRSGLDRNPDKIESEIESTRSRIEARLDALTNEFTPSTIMDRALGVNDANPDQDTFGLMIERARTNPFSAVMIAAGLAGMVLNKPDPRAQRLRSGERYPIQPYSDDPAQRIGTHIDTLETQASDLTGSAKAAAANVASTVSSAVSGAVDSVTGAFTSARDRVSSSAESASRTYEQTRRDALARGEEWRESARHAPVQAKAGAEYAADWVRANPLPAGLFALAAGATIASVFAASKSQAPRSRVRAAEELYETAEQDVAKRRVRRANIAAATASASATASDSAPMTTTGKRKTTVKKKSATSAKPKAAGVKSSASRKTAAAPMPAATTAPASTSTRDLPNTDTLGKNLDRSVAVQGKSTT